MQRQEQSIVNEGGLCTWRNAANTTRKPSFSFTTVLRYPLLIPVIQSPQTLIARHLSIADVPTGSIRYLKVMRRCFRANSLWALYIGKSRCRHTCAGSCIAFDTQRHSPNDLKQYPVSLKCVQLRPPPCETGETDGDRQSSLRLVAVVTSS